MSRHSSSAGNRRDQLVGVGEGEGLVSVEALDDPRPLALKALLYFAHIFVDGGLGHHYELVEVVVAEGVV